MKNSMMKPVAALIAILMLLSLACSFNLGNDPTPAPEATATAEQKAEPTQKPAPAEPTKESSSSGGAGAVTSLDDVKNATIQIQAEGTYIDPQVGMVVNGAGRGSGFIIDSSGIAVTNNHVVTGAALLKVWIGGDTSKIYNAKVIAASECSDLALIKIEGADFPYLAWHEGAPKVGLEIFAAGFPLGDPEFSLTKGIVSKSNGNGKTSWASIGSVLVHDATINPGNSGGPLVDKDGKLVGINYAGNSANQYFAITKAEADKILPQLEGGKDVTSIGVNGQIVANEDGSLSGVWVSSVKSGSPADKSGIKAGDLIFQLEGIVLGTDGTMADYCQILQSHKPADTLGLKIVRWSTQEILEGQINGRELTVTGTFGGGTTNNGGTTSGGVATIADDDNIITMDVPSDWEYDGSNWSTTWSIGGSSYPFVAQTITASPDVNAYSDGWDTTGIFVATSQDWGSIGGYAQLMEGVQDFYGDCKSGGRTNYKSDNYEGMMQAYVNCGPNRGNTIVLALRPRVNQSSYLVYVEMKYTTQEELDLLDQILGGTNINR